MSFIGAVLGDIAGSQFEFDKCPDWKKAEIFSQKCTYTDDTVMTLAIKHALDVGMDFADSMRLIGKNHMLSGYGGNFYKWMDSDEKLPPYGSYGNGSAMRVSYIADYFKKLEDVKKYAKKSAEATHNHPEGIKGAVVTAVCIWMAKNKKTKDEIYNYVLSEYPADQYKYSIDKDMSWLRKNYKWDVSCQGSVPVAMRCFIESGNYISFLRNVFSIKGDCDTLCAIGGSVAEEFYGKTGINNGKVLRHYLTDDLLNIVNGDYAYIVKNNNNPENNSKQYWGRTGSRINHGFCQAPLSRAYAFSPDELWGKDGFGDFLRVRSRKMQITLL